MKKRINKESILAAALEMVKEQGWDAISARSLAERLHCSTMPIYSAIGSMEQLRSELLEKSEQLLTDYQARDWGKNTLMNMAVGYIVFAREEKQLFRFLFKTEAWGLSADEVVKTGINRNRTMEHINTMQKMSRNQGQTLAFHSWIYIHGLAMLLADGFLVAGDGELAEWLDFAGGAFWTATGGR
ncbi:MAG: TetR/AcrR family transcriptional regulator [Spirochaetales bacterium]|nr:TetR/AcrR family transcriptional regulator [Spirochaetales bacterium]